MKDTKGCVNGVHTVLMSLSEMDIGGIVVVTLPL